MLMIDPHRHNIIQKPSAYRVSDVLGVLMFGHRFTKDSKEDFRSLSLAENLDCIIMQEIDDDKREFYKEMKKDAIQKKLDIISIRSNKVSDFLISKIKYIYVYELDI